MRQGPLTDTTGEAKMERMTQQHLQAIVDRINRTTGAPMKPYEKVGERYVAQIGNYHLSGAYGGQSLHRMVSEGGGISDVFGCGHVTKRDLADRMYAFIKGLEVASERREREAA